MYACPLGSYNGVPHDVVLMYVCMQEVPQVISHRVYIETESMLHPVWDLDSAGFPVSVCKVK